MLIGKSPEIEDKFLSKYNLEICLHNVLENTSKILKIAQHFWISLGKLVGRLLGDCDI